MKYLKVCMLISILSLLSGCAGIAVIHPKTYESDEYFGGVALGKNPDNEGNMKYGFRTLK